MKRYSISRAVRVNEHASKTGFYFQYSGRIDSPEKEIEEFKNNPNRLGLRIVDSQTKEVVFDELRVIKGKLFITFNDGDESWTNTQEYVCLETMRADEHYYKYEWKSEYRKSMRVVKVERIIL